MIGNSFCDIYQFFMYPGVIPCNPKKAMESILITALIYLKSMIP